MSAAPPKFIDAATLRRLVSMPDAIAASAVAFRALANGELDNPRRSGLSHQRALLMSAEHVSGSAVVKLISIDPDGYASGRPSMDGVVAWLDAETGRAGTLIDAAAHTSMRTAAASGLATSLLAPPGASVLAMLGAGGIASDQVAAVCAVRPIREVRVWSRRPERSVSLCAELEQEHGGKAAERDDRPVRFVATASSREALRGADVVCAATRASAPLFQPADLGSEMHVNSVGSYRHDMCELPPIAFGTARVVAVDQVEAALAEAGDLIQAIDAGLIGKERLVTVAQLLDAEAAGLGESHAPPGGGITIFKSVGIAAQDWAMAERAVRRAGELR